jgi:hypothetical protein
MKARRKTCCFDPDQDPIPTDLPYGLKISLKLRLRGGRRRLPRDIRQLIERNLGSWNGTVVCGAVPQSLCSLGRTGSVLGRRCRFDTRTLPSASGTYGGQREAAGLRDTGGFAFLNAAGIDCCAFQFDPQAAKPLRSPTQRLCCLDVGYFDVVDPAQLT